MHSFFGSNDINISQSRLLRCARQVARVVIGKNGHRVLRQTKLEAAYKNV